MSRTRPEITERWRDPEYRARMEAHNEAINRVPRKGTLARPPRVSAEQKRLLSLYAMAGNGKGAGR